jgi:hypothetical protein
LSSQGVAQKVPITYQEFLRIQLPSSPKSLGVSFSSPQEAVKEGHQVCAELAAGKTWTDVATEVLNQTNLSRVTRLQLGYAARQRFTNAQLRQYMAGEPDHLRQRTNRHDMHRRQHRPLLPGVARVL